MSITVHQVCRGVTLHDDLLACASFRRQMDLELGGSDREGFLQEYVDYLRAHVEDMPLWLAVENRGDRAPGTNYGDDDATGEQNDEQGSAVGYVQAALVHRAPALARRATPALHIGVVYTVPSARGRGIAAQMLRAVDEWADARGVHRMMLNARPEARSLYERSGFRAPDAMHMHRDAPFSTSVTGSTS